MSEPIEFRFDLSSSYSYFASLQIDALGTRCGRALLWHPFMLGTAFRVTGARGLTSTPLKREYVLRDWQRIAASRKLIYDPRRTGSRLSSDDRFQDGNCDPE